MESKTILRGDIWFATLDPTIGSEIRKRRPVVIVGNNAGNRAAGTVTVVPLTSNVERVFPFEVPLKARTTGLPKDCKACAQQVRTISKQRLASRRSGVAPEAAMSEIDAALRLHLALD